ncbi:MAG: 1,4-dihydroxy-2-naphthoyl-CoA hydrolase [Rhodothermales bacterium]|jgi:1,4-dihydroxy-2-naphthoyl-CoA hydrolase
MPDHKAEAIWVKTPSLSEVNARNENTMVTHLGIEVVEVGSDFLRATMPVDDTTKQPHGILHGGASLALAETVGSVAAAFCVDQATHYCVGLEINANHLRAVTSGVVTATARPIHLGRSTQVWETTIRDESDRLVSIGRLTMAVLTRG